jgi:hypothetical protein
MIDKHTLVNKIFPQRCKYCQTSGHLAFALWANILFDEKTNEVICWGCAHQHGLIKAQGPDGLIVNPEYRSAYVP